jgi:dimethylargininase
MSDRFDHAIVRPPGRTFVDGLTTVDLGTPDVARALEQHAAYCDALERCGLTLIRLPADDAFPDSTFVEDTALLFGRRAVLTRPGAASRAGEVAAIAPELARFFPAPDRLAGPGTLDGGDVCETDRLVLIGLSERTNEEGARQLARLLEPQGIPAVPIDIRGVAGILHLKSGLCWLGDGRVAVIDALAEHPALAGFERVRVAPEEAYAANCVRINDRLLIAAGYPRFEASLRERGYDVRPLEMSEFAKMDGGLTCLSLRFAS